MTTVEMLACFFFFFLQTFFCFHLVHSMGKGSRVIKRLPSGYWERLRYNPDARGRRGNPQGLWAPKTSNNA